MRSKDLTSVGFGVFKTFLAIGRPVLVLTRYTDPALAVRRRSKTDDAPSHIITNGTGRGGRKRKTEIRCRCSGAAIFYEDGTINVCHAEGRGELPFRDVAYCVRL